MVKFFGLIVFFILFFDNFAAEDDMNKWSREKWLDQNYFLKWTTDILKKEVTFKVEVKTKGWVSLGLSKHGRMSEVDKVIGWVDQKGHSHFDDYWVGRNGVQTIDKSQDWILLLASENSTHTVLEFSRHFVTCDDDNDLDIYENDYEFSNIVFEYSCNDPKDGKEDNLTHQGKAHVNLVQYHGVQFKPKEKDVKTHDLWLNVTVPSNNISNQFCQMLKLDDFKSQSIIKVEPYTSNSSVFVYLNLIKCPREWAENNFERFKNKVFGCYDINDTLHEGRSKCQQKLILSPVKSTEPIILPNFVGIHMDTAETPYVMLHGYFINKFNKDINVVSSLRLWSTLEKRKTETDFQLFGISDGHGHMLRWPFILPPKQESFIVSGAASSYCLNKDDEMNDIGIFIYYLIFKSFSAETHEVRHYRKEQMLRFIRIHHYDAEYQPFRHLINPINFRKTDQLVVSCEFNTINETKSLTATQRRCILGAYYYPKMKNIKDAKFIKSRMAYKTMLNITNLEQIDNHNGLVNDTVIRKPVELNNTKPIDFITENKYPINYIKDLERMQIMADNYECCGYLQEINKNETCQLIEKPLDLYERVVGKEIHKYCPETKHKDNGFSMKNFNLKLPSFNVSKFELPKMKISLKFISDTFKFLFQTSML